MRTNGTDTLREYEERDARTVQSEQDALARARFATPLDDEAEERRVKQVAVAQFTPRQSERRAHQWDAGRQLFIVPLPSGLTREQLVFAEQQGNSDEYGAFAAEFFLLSIMHEGLAKRMTDAAEADRVAKLNLPF